MYIHACIFTAGGRPVRPYSEAPLGKIKKRTQASRSEFVLEAETSLQSRSGGLCNKLLVAYITRPVRKSA